MNRIRHGVPRVSRRTLLGGVAGAAGLAGLAACSPDTGTGDPNGNGNGGSGGKTAEPPAYVPFTGVKPDLPGTAEGVAPGFYNYPKPAIAMDGFPLTGIEPFTALVQGGPPEPGPDKNKNYDLMAEQLGTSFETIFGTYASYLEKFQVTMASGDLPDMMQVVSVAELPKLLEKNFTDLTDVLAGDGVTKYQGLANIPPATWKVATVNGRIWGVARPQAPSGLVVNYHLDDLESRGVTPADLELDSGEDFLAVMKELTDEKAGKFAMGADPSAWLLQIAKQMAGTPNGWANDGGTFVSDIASPQMKDALAWCQKVWAAGVLHPNSFADPGQNGVWYNSGVTALYIRGFNGWDFDIRKFPDTTVGVMVPPKLDGGGAAPVHRTPAGYGAFMGLRKTDDAARLDQLLQVFNYCAAPFGTEQYLAMNYGVEGYSYDFDDKGNPVPIDNAPATPDAYTYAGGARASTIYAQGDKASVDLRHSYLTKVIPTSVEDASTGLYSDTATSDAAAARKEMDDVVRRVIEGSAQMSAWDEYVKRWKSQIGDKVAAEYEEAAAAG